MIRDGRPSRQSNKKTLTTEEVKVRCGQTWKGMTHYHPMIPRTIRNEESICVTSSIISVAHTDGRLLTGAVMR